MLVGVRVHVRPVGDAELVSVTVPVNPLTGAMVMVDVAATVAVVETEVGLAAMEKSAAAVIVKLTVAVWVKAPLVPVTVAENVPALEPVQDNVEVPEPVTLVGERVQTSEGSLGATVNATAPVKPLVAEIVTVEVPATPTVVDTVVGLAVIVKPGTGGATLIINVELVLTLVPEVALMVA